MPYIAQRKFMMFSQGFAAPGNAYDLPHIIPADLIDRMPHRSLQNMLARRMIVQVDTADISVGDTRVVAPLRVPTDLDADPRVENEGHGWWLVDGKRVHGRKGARDALAELGG